MNAQGCGKGAVQVLRALECPSGSGGQVGAPNCVNCGKSVTSGGLKLNASLVGQLLRALIVYEDDEGVADCRLSVCDDCDKSKSLDSFFEELSRLEPLRFEFNKRRKIVGGHVLRGSLGRSNKDFRKWEAEVDLISDVLPMSATRNVKRTTDVAVGPDIKMEKEDIPMNPQDIKVEIKQEEIEISESAQETFDHVGSDGLEPVERTLDVNEPLTNQSDAVDIRGCPETNGESRLRYQQQKTDSLKKTGAADEARKTSKSRNRPSPAQRPLQPESRLSRRRNQKTFETTKAASVKGTDEGEVTTNNVPSDSSLAVEQPRLAVPMRKGRSNNVEEQSDEAEDKNVDGFLPSDRGADSTASVDEGIYNPGDQRSKNVVKCSGETCVPNAHCRSEIDGHSAPCGGRPRRATRKRVRYGESQNEGGTCDGSADEEDSEKYEDADLEEVGDFGGTGEPSVACKPLTMSRCVRQPKKGTGGSNYYPRCQFCSKICKGYSTLRRHCYVDHKQKYLKDLPFRFACLVCYRVFPSAMTLENHKKTHESLKCNVCGKFCVTKRYLIEHRRAHTGEKPYACNACDWKFSREHDLKGHMKTHSVEKPFACYFCCRKFYTDSNLKSHIKTHTGEKPYACDVCHRKFAYSCTLKSHLKTHTGEKPYACYFCDRKFSREKHLQFHMMTHTGEKPYACNVCDRKFSREHHLKDHKKIHTGEKPYKCSCGEYFRWRSNMKSHKRTTGHS